MNAPRAGRVAQASITVGFGAALVMWIVGFLARLPGVQASPMIVADLFGVVQITAGAMLGGLIGGRRGILAGAVSGLVAGAVNLLILGSLVSDPAKVNSLRAEWALTLGAFLVVLPALGLIGAGAGAAMRAKRALGKPERPINWHGWFAIIAAGATLALLVLGGLVTSLEAGLAVPDWPNSYGFNMLLYPLSHMEGGKYFEHAHRLFGMLVGLGVISLLVFSAVVDRRRWVVGLCVGALALVILQGVMGGMRVTGKPTLSQTATEPSRVFAVLHGVLGQLFFAYVACLGCVTSAAWKRLGDAPVPAMTGAPRKASITLLALLIVQLALGALARHFDASAGYLHIVATHGVNALLVTSFAVVVGVRAARTAPPNIVLRRLGKGLMHATGLQFLLGVGALLVILSTRKDPAPSTLEVIIATAHQTLGALLLAGAGAMALWIARLSRGGAAPSP